MNPVAVVGIGLGVIAFVAIAVLVVHHFRFVIWSGYMRVVFTGEDRKIAVRIIKADESDRDFEIEVFGKHFKYGIDRNRIYRIGRFRLPTAYYKFGDAVPIDMLKTGHESDVAALDYAQVARNTVTRDLLAAFDTKFLSAQNIFVLTILTIAGGLLMLGVFVNIKVDELKGLHTVPGQPATTGSPPNADDLRINE